MFGLNYEGLPQLVQELENRLGYWPDLHCRKQFRNMKRLLPNIQHAPNTVFDVVQAAPTGQTSPDVTMGEVTVLDTSHDSAAALPADAPPPPPDQPPMQDAQEEDYPAPVVIDSDSQNSAQ